MIRLRQSSIPGNGPSTSRHGRLLVERGVFPSITAPNLRFLQGLGDTLRNINKEVFPVVISSFLNDVRPDHFYIASDSPKSYEQFKDHIKRSGGELLREVPFKGRRIAVLRLPKPIKINEYFSVEYVELGEPKPGKPEKNNVAHLAYLVTGSDPKAGFDDMLEKMETNGELNCGVAAQLSFLWRDMWGTPPELVGFKMHVRRGDTRYQVEIRRTPIV